MKSVSALLPEDVYRLAKASAEASGLTLTGVVRVALEEYLTPLAELQAARIRASAMLAEMLPSRPGRVSGGVRYCTISRHVAVVSGAVVSDIGAYVPGVALVVQGDEPEWFATDHRLSVARQLRAALEHRLSEGGLPTMAEVSIAALHKDVLDVRS